MIGFMPVIVVVVALFQSAAVAANFTRGTSTATKFGVHEISLTGNGGVANPYDTVATVTFTPPSGSSNAVTVHAFYDGGNAWRARTYVTETGTWSWTSSSATDSGLNAKSGSFSATGSSLPGKLKKHPTDNKAWATDDGKWFLNISDTAYYLFNAGESSWQQFVIDNWGLGVTSLRSNLVGALRQVEKQQSSDGWDRIFSDSSRNFMNVGAFQTQDQRMEWMLNNYPELFIQLIVTPEPSNGWQNDESFWAARTTAQRTRFMRYVVARYAAWPQIFWLVTNDAFHGSGYPNNNAMVSQIGQYLADNDPWKQINLRSSGRNRGEPFYFTSASWVSYIHLETENALSGDQVSTYAGSPRHVFNGEDLYEGEKPITNDAYFFRRLFWAWTLSGGSANYGGYWNDIKPYSQTTFTGLNDVAHIVNFFDDNSVELAGWVPSDSSVSGPTGVKRVKVMRRPDNSAFVMYHPNAASDGTGAALASGTASLTVNSLAAGSYSLVWTRADDGAVSSSTFTHGGGNRLLTAPWAGKDVIAYLRSSEAPPSSNEYQAEAAPVLSGVTVETTNAGYTGSGYADFGGNGTYVEWNNIHVATAGTYTLTFRFAANSNRQCELRVNGANVGNLAFANTGGWANWQNETKVVTLNAGNNTLRVAANTSAGGPNLDRVSHDGSAPPSSAEYQAEAAPVLSGVTVETTNAGYTGSGYADFGGNGTYLEWTTINAPTAGTYTLTFRYAGNSTRQCQLRVNGVSVGNLAFASTGSWTNWQTETKVVTLNAGNNVLRVVANTSAGGPNLDRMVRQ